MPPCAALVYASSQAAGNLPCKSKTQDATAQKYLQYADLDGSSAILSSVGTRSSHTPVRNSARRFHMACTSAQWSKDFAFPVGRQTDKAHEAQQKAQCYQPVFVAASAPVLSLQMTTFLSCSRFAKVLMPATKRQNTRLPCIRSVLCATRS